MSETADKAALVVGLGFMGGSLAAALRRAGWTVYLHHRRQAVMRTAEERGYGIAVDDPREAMPACQVAVVCTPVSAIPQLVRDLAQAPGDTVITDIGSTKSRMCAQLEDLARSGRFIGSHPMAGSHLQGLEYADPDLYRGTRCAITPHERCPGGRIAILQTFWYSIGCTCHPYTADDHDQAVAEGSHLPHILASAAAAALTERGLALAAAGFRDTTRVAAASPELWTDIIFENRKAVAYQLSNSIVHQQELLQALRNDDREALLRWLEKGRQGRQGFERRSLR
jgi:prephenate dehydrogenase